MEPERPQDDEESSSLQDDSLTKEKVVTIKDEDNDDTTKMLSLQEEREMKKRLALEYAKSYAPPQKIDDEEDFSLDQYPMREWQINVPWLLEDPIAFNPITSLIGVAALWGIAIWCMSEFVVPT